MGPCPVYSVRTTRDRVPCYGRFFSATRLDIATYVSTLISRSKNTLQPNAHPRPVGNTLCDVPDQRLRTECNDGRSPTSPLKSVPLAPPVSIAAESVLVQSTGGASGTPQSRSLVFFNGLQQAVGPRVLWISEVLQSGIVGVRTQLGKVPGSDQHRTQPRPGPQLRSRIAKSPQVCGVSKTQEAWKAIWFAQQTTIDTRNAGGVESSPRLRSLEARTSRARE